METQISHLGPVDRESLPEQVSRALKRLILYRPLKAGDRLPSERELAEITSVSRNVVREALQILVDEGYVEKEAGRGVFVRPHDPAQLQSDLVKSPQDPGSQHELEEVRLALEAGSLPLVMSRITKSDLHRLNQLVEEMRLAHRAGRSLTALDRAFHSTLMDATGNATLISLRKAVMRALHGDLIESFGPMPRSWLRDAKSISTAMDLVQALEQRDLDAAQQALWSHLTLPAMPGESRLFLFVDDADLAEVQSLTQSVNVANKHPLNPLMSAEFAWEGQGIFPSATVLYDPERRRYRMWYGGYRYLSRRDELYSVCYAESVDGIHWQKPALGLHTFEGAPAGNLLMPWGDPQRPDTLSCNILFDPTTEDPARRYTMIHFCEGLHPIGLGLSFSADGLRWIPWEKNPVDSNGAEPVGDVLYTLTEPGTGKIVAYYRVRLRVRPHRTLARAESTDLLNWTGHQVILETDEQDPPGAEMYGMTPFRYGNLILALLWVSTENCTRMEIQLACSRDGFQWQRVANRQPFLPRGSQEAFDAGWAARPTVPIKVGDELWFYYMGVQEPGVWPEASGWGQIGLATVPLDRMVSLDAGEDEGTVVTKPLVIAEEDKILLNAVVNPGGYVRTELLDEHGRILDGYSSAEAIPFQGNELFHCVSWQRGSDLIELVGRTVQVRFSLRHARLYAFRLCDPETAEADLGSMLC